MVAAWVAVMLAYLLLPSGVRGLLNLVRPSRVAWQDTTRLMVRERSALAELSMAESNLRRLRLERDVASSALAPRGLTAEQSAGRDSLSQVATALGALVQRAANAPLAESFRTLGQSPELRDNPSVRALVDSLADVERERDELGGGATVDPVYVALTTQANALGRAIQSIAEARLSVLNRDIASLRPSAPPTNDSAAVALPDTTAAAAAVKSAQYRVTLARREIAALRATNQTAATAESNERSRTQLAPVTVLMLGASIIAAAITFALVMFDEMRSPRVADAAEAERLTFLRVLAVVGTRPVPEERARRAADRSIPAPLDPTFDAYRILAWHLTSQWPQGGVITVTGDDVLVAATVAANLAAVLANDARITLLVDADFQSEPVRTVLALPRSPGLAAVLDNRRKWSESLIPIAVGRSRTLDVLQSGTREKGIGQAEAQALTSEIQRAARRHDATIVVTSLAGAKQARAGDDVIVCATQTRTRLSTLGRNVASLVDGGARVRGVVLWEGAPPRVERSIAGRPPGGDTSRAA